MRNQESHLGHIHAGVTAQWPDSGEVIGPQQGGDYSVLVDLPDHGGINEVHEPVLVHGDTWGGKHGDGIFVSLFVVLCFDGRIVCGGDGGNRTLGMMCLDQGPYWDGRASFRTVTLSAFKASISQGLCAVTCTIPRVLALSLNPPPMTSPRAAEKPGLQVKVETVPPLLSPENKLLSKSIALKTKKDW